MRTVYYFTTHINHDRNESNGTLRILFIDIKHNTSSADERLQPYNFERIRFRPNYTVIREPKLVEPMNTNTNLLRTTARFRKQQLVALGSSTNSCLDVHRWCL